MNRWLWISALCLAAARPAWGDWTAGAAIGDQEQISYTTTFSTNPSPEIGSGTGSISRQVSDAFVPIAAVGTGGLSGATISGSILDLRPEPPAQGLAYADEGISAQLTVDVRLFWAASTDPAGLFAAYGSGVTVASFQVGNGLMSPLGPTPGDSFSATLAEVSLPTPGGPGGSYYLGFAGHGQASGMGVSSTSVVGDLSGFSLTSPPAMARAGFVAMATPVPEPSSVALLLIAAPAGLAIAIRRGRARRRQG